MSAVVAALFVETEGCYFGLPDVDPWDINRDARTYGGTDVVIAHPPCERWGRFSGGSPKKRGYITGDDDGCFESAFRHVTMNNGVLEHPAGSKAFDRFLIGRPPASGGWVRARHRGWMCHVEQGHYGHVARKATWLFAVLNYQPPDLIWGPSPQRLPAKRLAERGYESARRCGAVANQSHRQRQRTPVPFRDLLLSLAREEHP